MSRLTMRTCPPRSGTSWRTLAEAVPKATRVQPDPDVDAWKQMLLAYGTEGRGQSSTRRFASISSDEIGTSEGDVPRGDR
jgi:hypothetical protein